LPWVNFLGLKLTEIADRKQRQFKNNSKHLDVLEKSEYEAKAQEFKARRKKAIVESAKASEEANEIQDPIIRQKAQDDLQEVKEESSFRMFPMEFSNEFNGPFRDGLENVSAAEYALLLQDLNERLMRARETQQRLVADLEMLEKNNSDADEVFSNYMDLNDANEDKTQFLKSKLHRATEIEIYNQEKVDLVATLKQINATVGAFEDQIELINMNVDKKYGF